ncbi:M23 family metallopeptidase [Myxococcota bacterium]|nr:M23 family metallopeptidase [Myxococcota bacterium]
MLDQEYAGIIAQRGLGLSALLASQLGAAEEAGASGELDELDEAAVQPPALQPAASQPAALQPAALQPAALQPAVITALSARPSMTEGAQAAASLRAPTRGRVTQTFGLNRHGARHEGLDIAAPEGQPIHAARAGVVRFAGARGAQGQAVIVDHGEGLTTLYAHASRLLVAPGARVAEGQAIARVGSTGQSTGAHLHFEARRDGQALNPAHLLGQPGLQVGELLKPAASTRALAAYGAAR